MEMGFNPKIVEYICKRLREGVADSTISDELMRTDNPLFLPINNDFGVAISYLAYAKKVCRKGMARHHWHWTAIAKCYEKVASSLRRRQRAALAGLGFPDTA